MDRNSRALLNNPDLVEYELTQIFIPHKHSCVEANRESRTKQCVASKLQLQCVAVCQQTNVAVCSPKSVCRINPSALGQHGSSDHRIMIRSPRTKKNQNKTNSMTQLNITELCIPFEHVDTCALKQHTDHDTQPTNKYI